MGDPIREVSVGQVRVRLYRGTAQVREGRTEQPLYLLMTYQSRDGNGREQETVRLPRETIPQAMAALRKINDVIQHEPLPQPAAVPEIRRRYP